MNELLPRLDFVSPPSPSVDDYQHERYHSGQCNDPCNTRRNQRQHSIHRRSLVIRIHFEVAPFLINEHLVLMTRLALGGS